MYQLDYWRSAISHSLCYRPALVEKSPNFKLRFFSSLNFLFSLSYHGYFTQYRNIPLERKSQNIVAFGEEHYLTSLWTSSMGKAFKAFYWQAGTISDLFPATSAV